MLPNAALSCGESQRPHDLWISRPMMMTYQLYQTQADLIRPLRSAARYGAGLAGLWDFGTYTPAALRHLQAAWALFADAVPTHGRPEFGIKTIKTGTQCVRVTERAVAETPFATLLHFRKDAPVTQPPVLLVAPMSGHFATLLRATVRAMLPEHDVYLTDWHNARDIPLAHGGFGLDDFIAHLLRFLEVIGPGAHMVAVCQPAVAALAATALMAEDDHPAQPRSLTLMAGPIDTRVNATQVNRLAAAHPIAWFERRLITNVPWRYQGAFRRVYPGFMQLTAFMSMNLDRHIGAHLGHFRALVGGDDDSATAHRRFYGEYRAVMDLPGEFFIDTVRRVFQEHEMPLGRFAWRGRAVRPEAIRHTALLTIEGERDDICAIGQTAAAHDLCPSIPAAAKRHHVQPGVGHYGVFSGRRWANEIYPRVAEIIRLAA
jgi:poly(3-hydroxybutyrate) depolymerase